MILLKLIFKKVDVDVWTKSGWVILGKWVKMDEREHLADPGENGLILLKLIFRMWDVRVWT